MFFSIYPDLGQNVQEFYRIRLEYQLESGSFKAFLLSYLNLTIVSEPQKRNADEESLI